MKAKLKTIKASKISVKPIRWFWPGRIPACMSSLILGLSEASKSILMSYFAAQLSRGVKWPDGSSCNGGKKGSVLMFSAEEDLSRTLVPRLKAMGADLDKIAFAQGVKTGPEKDAWFDVKKNLPSLKKYIEKIRPQLVIIDPITGYLSRTSGDENLDIRSALSPLEKIAEKYKTTVLLVTHTHKNVDISAPALHQAIGSIAYGAVVRSAWLVMRNPDDNEHRLFLKAKLSIGLAKPGLSYRIKQVGSNPSRVRLVWDKLPIEQTAEEMLYRHRNLGRPPQKYDKAKEIILAAFKGTDTIKSTKIRNRLGKAGISYKTYMKAKKALGVKSISVVSAKTKEKFWLWKIEKQHP